MLRRKEWQQRIYGIKAKVRKKKVLKTNINNRQQLLLKQCGFSNIVN